MADGNSPAGGARTNPSKPTDKFCEVPIEVMISVGKAYPLVGELLQLGSNSVLKLDQKIDDPVELFVGNKLIARGELQELEGEDAGQLAVRLTEVVSVPENC